MSSLPLSNSFEPFKQIFPYHVETKIISANQYQYLVAKVSAVVVVGELRLPAADAVDDRHAEAVVGRAEVAILLWIEPHERRAFDLHLKSLRMQDRVGTVSQNRRPAAERRVPEPAVLSRWVERIRIGIVVPDGGEARLLRPSKVARVDQVVGQDVPSPWSRRPKVVEILGIAACRWAAIGARRPGRTLAVKDHRPAWSGWRQALDISRP